MGRMVMTIRRALVRAALAAALCAAAALPGTRQAAAETLMRVVMHSDLKILDPIWTTAYISRNHGYMIYDTLLAMNAQQEPQPQMAEKWEVSADKLTYTFTLRDGLKWHDGAPVTSDDCIASIKRWAARDSMGQKLMASVASFQAVDPKTFKLILKEPYGLVLRSDRNIDLFDYNTLGFQYVFRFNSTQAPFDKPKIRQAAFAAFNQQDFLQAVIGDPEFYTICPALFVCGTTFASDKGTAPYFHSDFALSKKLLAEAGYDGMPVLLMHSTDLQALTNLAPVAKSLLERGGFKVNMVDMDWQSVVARRAKKVPVSEGGWNAFLTAWAAADILNPVAAAFLAANCDAAAPGWPCDAEMERLRDAFGHETDLAKQKEIAEQVPLRAIEVGTPVWVGQYP